MGSWRQYLRLGVVHYGAFPTAGGSAWIRSFCHILGDGDFEAVDDFIAAWSMWSG